MPSFMESLVQHREAILLGEFGALLHMFGKASSEFLVANSIEGGARDSHQELKHLGALEQVLRATLLRDRFAFTVEGAIEKLTCDFTDFITKYKGSQPDSHLLRLFNTCHRMTSADEKGVVRRPQSIHYMRIVTPFGREARRVEVDRIDELRQRMAEDLARSLEEYQRSRQTVESFRERAIEILRPGMSAALGETREPANDVTLWAQSYGVASLYKSCLAALAIGQSPCPKKNGDWDYENVRWRLLGVGWNGLGFVQRGRKPADMLRRQEILGEVRRELQRWLEVTYPVGNLFYADLNGAFFTFPGVDHNAASELVAEAVRQLVDTIRCISDNELWPFFTLSRPRRTLTVIAREIQNRDALASAPCVAVVLSIEDENAGPLSRHECLLVPGPSLPPPQPGADVCPVCQFRTKPATSEMCGVCQDRRKGRLARWQERPAGETIWVDEIADANNRMALLTLKFDLARWLSGEWFTTILSQTFDEWFSSARLRRLKQNQQLWRKVQKLLSPASPASDFTTAARLIEYCATDPTADTGFKAPLLSTFFEDIQINQHEYVARLEQLLQRIDESGARPLSSAELVQHIFTQNASPGRLLRVWEAAADFLDGLIARLRSGDILKHPERLRFRTSGGVAGVEDGETYRIIVPGLEGGPLVVFAVNSREFLTVDCLEKFRFGQGKKLTGAEAVRTALSKSGVQSWREEATGILVSGFTPIEDVEVSGRYLPFAVLSRSPVSSQILLPAGRVPKALEALLDLEAEHFELVRGKLVLHVGVLVTKRKFPLYALLEAGQQIVGHPGLGEGCMQHPWWRTQSVNDFYHCYPTKQPDGRGHGVASLAPMAVDRQYWLTTGFFDFDFMGATIDRHRLRYQIAPNAVRPSIAYGWLQPRPTPLHRLREMFTLWALLCNVGPTQRHQIEAALAGKLEQWRAVGQESRGVFLRFAQAVLRDAFGEGWFTALQDRDRQLLLRSATNGLLLDTIEFFEHVVKGEVAYE